MLFINKFSLGSSLLRKIKIKKVNRNKEIRMIIPQKNDDNE